MTTRRRSRLIQKPELVVRDYSHLLDERQRQQDYGLRVEDHGTWFDVVITHQGEDAGGVQGRRQVDTIQITDADAGHYGKRLGQAAYEAAYDYFRARGVTRAVGNDASHDALRMHQRLATKYGLDLRIVEHEDEDGFWHSWSYDLTLARNTSTFDSSSPKKFRRSDRRAG